MDYEDETKKIIEKTKDIMVDYKAKDKIVIHMELNLNQNVVILSSYIHLN